MSSNHFLSFAQGRPRLRGAFCQPLRRRRSSHPSAVRFQEPAESLLAADVREQDRLGIIGLLATNLISNGRVIFQALVGPEAVVKIQVHFAEMVQVLGTKDQKVIEQLVAESLDKPLDVGLHVRCAVGNLHRLRSLALQFLVERLRELAVSVVDHVCDGEAIGPCLVHKCLGLPNGPILVGVQRCGGKYYASSLDVQKGNHKRLPNPAQRQDFLAEEVDLPEGAGVLFQELVPSCFASVGGRIETGLLQDVTDGGPCELRK